MAKRYNLSVPMATNTNKPFWHNVGTLFVSDSGQMSIKLNSFPCGEVQDQNGVKKAFDGWIKCFDADRGAQGGSTSTQGQSTGRKVSDNLDDDIPFR